MDDRTRPDTNVVLLRRKGDPCEAERERVASTIFAEPDDVATFSRGNLVPPRPDAGDANEVAPSPDPFFDRLDEPSKTDGPQGTELAEDGESTAAYFDRLASQSPAEMSASGPAVPAASPMPGSAQLPTDLAAPSPRRDRQSWRLIPSALTVRLWAALRRSRFAWRLSAATIGVAAAVIAGIVVIGELGSAGSEQQRSQSEASAASLESLRPGFLAAPASPFGAPARVHRSVARVHRPHPSSSRRPKSHRPRTTTSRPMQTPVNHRVVAANYTPVQHTSTSTGATPDTQSSATGATTPATPPVPPTHYTSSSNSGSGSSTSSSSASPSKATFRSLVTGAGTCSCQ